MPRSQPLPALRQPPFHLELPSAPDLHLHYYTPASSLLSMLLPFSAGWAAAGTGLNSTPAANWENWCCGLFAELFQVVQMEKCVCV